MGLQILIAGCAADERPRVENAVRRAIGARADSGAWSVSLVKLGGEWSVTIDGPEPPFRGLSLTTPEIRLQNAIVEALSKTKPAAGRPAAARPARPATSPVSSTSETRDRHRCPGCGADFLVIYAIQPGEPTTKAPVACPGCWQVTQVPVSETAAQHQDYRAEAV